MESTKFVTEKSLHRLLAKSRKPRVCRLATLLHSIDTEVS